MATITAAITGIETTSTFPLDTDLTLEYDHGTPIGTANLVQDGDTITVTGTYEPNYERWVRNRPVMAVEVVDGEVVCAGVFPMAEAPDPSAEWEKEL